MPDKSGVQVVFPEVWNHPPSMVFAVSTSRAQPTVSWVSGTFVSGSGMTLGPGADGCCAARPAGGSSVDSRAPPYGTPGCPMNGQQASWSTSRAATVSGRPLRSPSWAERTRLSTPARHTHRTTVSRFACITGEHAVRVHDHRAQDLRVTSLQADERHGFVGRKDQPCREATVIDPRSKFLVQNVLGARTTDLAVRLLFGAQARLHDPHSVVLFTDGWPPYESLFSGVFGRPFQPTRKRKSWTTSQAAIPHSQDVRARPDHQDVPRQARDRHPH